MQHCCITTYNDVHFYQKTHTNKMQATIKLSKWKLRGVELQYIIRQSGIKNRQFAQLLNLKNPDQVYYQFYKPFVNAKVRDVCINLVGIDNYEFYLTEYRNARNIVTTD